MSTIPLLKWNEWLWAEIFHDEAGDGQPVSIIHVDDNLFARASSRGGLSLSPGEARISFLSAFPDRLQIQRWLVGSSHPGAAMLPLLILCCLAASEAAESDENDYRARMRDLMGWDERIINCEGLPRLWATLGAETRQRSKSIPTRQLTLPDPRHRTQIGHAIELTFPSRNDTRRLLSELGSGGFDLDAPRAVLEWLTPIVARGRFSPSFKETFESFRAAWLNAERALADHRFWSGWKLATQTLRQVSDVTPFEVASDEWGHRHLVAPPNDDPFDLDRAIRSRALPASLLATAMRSHAIPLREAEWGRLRWTGATTAAQIPDALLIRERAFGSRAAQFDLSPVTGANEWGLTFKVGVVLGERREQSFDRDRLIEATPTGITRVDGGILCRPALPFFIDVRGYVNDVTLEGPLSSSMKIERLQRTRWRVTPRAPLEGDVSLVVEPINGTTNLVRTLRLRRSALTPSYRSTAPERLIDVDSYANWPAGTRAAPPITDLPALAEESASPAAPLLDFIEFLAVRTAPMPLAAIVELLDQMVGEDGPSTWDLLRSLADAGLIRTFRTRGWPGRTLMSSAPRGWLLRVDGSWALMLEGILNETAIHRLETAAHGMALELQRRYGVSTWSPETFVILAEREDQLRELASRVELPTQYLCGTLADAPPLISEPVTAPQSHSMRRPLALSGRHAPLFFVDSDKANQAPVWEVDHRGSAEFWRSRDEAVLNAYLTVGERPFTLRDGVLFAAEARLPSAVARWMRLFSGRASGPLEDGRYGYATSKWVEHALRDFAPRLIVRDNGAARSPVAPDRMPISRSRPPLIAVNACDKPGFRELWQTMRGGW